MHLNILLLLKIHVLRFLHSMFLLVTVQLVYRLGGEQIKFVLTG